MKKLAMSALAAFAVLLLPAAAQAANSLDVNMTAALNGTTYGLEVIGDGSNNQAYVRDNTPNGETVYRATWWVDPNSAINNSANSRGKLFLMFNSSGPLVNGQRQSAKAMLVKRSATKYAVLGWCIDNGGGNRKTFRDPGVDNTHAIVVNDEPLQITMEVEMMNGQNGTCALTVSGATSGTITHTRANYQSGAKAIDQIFLGATRDLNGPVGSVYFDEFSSFRTLAPN